jgi:trans-aconitate methyltransferase
MWVAATEDCWLSSPFGFGHYLGVDFSRAAIDRATSLCIPAAEFEVADFETWDAPRRFDIVIFNESLYYAHQPAEMVERSLRWLNNNGLVVVSMWRHGDVRRIWKAVDSAPGFMSSTPRPSRTSKDRSGTSRPSNRRVDNEGGHAPAELAVPADWAGAPT